jgi:broad specificity phosphatase PhoE
MKLIIVRHGQTTWNERGKIQGVSDPPLSKRGKQQAELLAKRFSNEKLDAIYTSTLQRAIKTGEAIANYHPAIGVQKRKELNEMDWGEWEGLTIEQIKARFPEQYTKRLADKFNFAPKAGESPARLQRKIAPFLKKLVAKHTGQSVLIVGHNGINRVILGTILEWSPKRITDVLTNNTAVCILYVKTGKSRMHLFNCTKHLETTLSKKKLF